MDLELSEDEIGELRLICQGLFTARPDFVSEHVIESAKNLDEKLSEVQKHER